MFNKKFLESNFAPMSVVTSRQSKTTMKEASDIPAVREAQAGLLSRHKGKLAVGAAAMLGIAAFYHWRESKLAKEDEEEYARLQRLKAALEVDDPNLEE